MEDSSPEAGPPDASPLPPRGARAWWLWTAAVALVLLLAVYELGIRRRSSTFTWLLVPQREPQVSGELREAQTILAEPGALAGCNLLLVTIDTTRVDRIGCYGNENIKTPTLDRLAREGVLFSQALAPAPTTLPTHATILTGLYPAHHGARTNGLFRLQDQHYTLAEVLGPEGYATGAMVSAFVLETRFGLSQGFGCYDDEVGIDGRPDCLGAIERRADKTTDRAIAWLENVFPRPFFLWVHYFDPHAIYHPPEPYATVYADNPYDGEIAFVDSELNRLLTVIDGLGLTDETLVVATADHGEGLGDHGEHTHGILLYDVTLRVPLIMNCGKRLGGGIHVGRRVSLVDVAPTVLSLLAVETSAPTDGVDLTRPWPQTRTLFAETHLGAMEYGWASLFALYDGKHKYIHGPNPELFDLHADPFERNNLWPSQTESAAEFRSKLADLFGAELDSSTGPDPTMSLGPDELSRLAALGYVFATTGEIDPDRPRPDPRERIPLINRIFEITSYYQPRGYLDTSIRLLEELADDYPDAYIVFVHLGEAYGDADRQTDAAAAYERCLELNPRAPEALYRLGMTRIAQGAHDEAAELLMRLLSAHPDQLAARYALARTLSELGRHNQAADQIKLAFDLDPSHEDCAALMVRLFTLAGRDAEAKIHLRRRLDQDPRQPKVCGALAEYLTRRKCFDEAEALLREGVALMPDNGMSVGQLAWFLATCPDETRRDTDQARILLERHCTSAGSDDPQAMFTLARIHARAGRKQQAVKIAEKAGALAEEQQRDELDQSVSTFLQRMKSGAARIGSAAPADDR